MSQNINSMTVTWNNAGTTFAAIQMDVTDTASNAASKLLDLKVAGTSKFSVNKTGSFTAANGAASADFSNIGGSLVINNTHRFDGNSGSFTNHPAGSIGWASGALGTGAPTIDTPMTRVAAGIVKVAHGSATTGGAVVTDPCTVANLPAAATAGSGARAFVTDANSVVFNAAAVGGGANKMPVFSNGVGWFIG